MVRFFSPIAAFNPDIPFHQDNARRFLPWIVAFLVYVAAIFLHLALSFNVSMAALENDTGGTVLVQIPGRTPDRDGAIQRITVAARAFPGVKEVEQIPEARLRELLSPWLGQGQTAGSLPLPIVIEIKVSGEAGALRTHLKGMLAKTLPDVTVTGGDQWAQKLGGLTTALKAFSWFLLGLTCLATIAVIACLTQASLRIHKDTLDVLHDIGATVEYITRQFQQHMLRLAARGCVIGLLAATVTLVLLGFGFSSIDSPLLPRFDFTTITVVALMMLGVASCLTALVATRLTVQRLLAA